MSVLKYYMGTTTLVDYEENPQTINTNAIPSTEDIQAMLAQVYATVKEEEETENENTFLL